MQILFFWYWDNKLFQTVKSSKHRAYSPFSLARKPSVIYRLSHFISLLVGVWQVEELVANTCHLLQLLHTDYHQQHHRSGLRGLKQIGPCLKNELEKMAISIPMHCHLRSPYIAPVLLQIQQFCNLHWLPILHTKFNWTELVNTW